jgi:hypothetical protein
MKCALGWLCCYGITLHGNILRFSKSDSGIVLLHIMFKNSKKSKIFPVIIFLAPVNVVLYDD